MERDNENLTFDNASIALINTTHSIVPLPFSLSFLADTRRNPSSTPRLLLLYVLVSWLYDTYLSPDLELLLIILSYLPIISAVYRRWIHHPVADSPVSLSAFGVVFLSIYSNEIEAHNGKPGVSNILFVDQPVGTGFSYSSDRRNIRHNEKGVSDDLYDFIQAFYKEYRELAENDFYITGESYAGHYIPAFAACVHQGNKDKDGIHINLKGFAISRRAMTMMHLLMNMRLLRQPKWGHLKDLHRAIKLCEPALVSISPVFTPLGNHQEAHVFKSNGACAAFLSNYDQHSFAKVSFENKHYNLPMWSISILPDCKNTVYNTARCIAESVLLCSTITTDNETLRI
ncbi:hypothetical protein CASFOL_028066 [Castilleja foliolosa]|uniref:Carboxypeptidase n=1 Tax=Castilleja foliolosa TaxID=1961234 RepID=A0ABD3CFA0_9LAMI